MKIIGIIGSRSRDTDEDFWKVNEEFHKLYKEGDWICSGGCPKGGDRFAEKIARINSTPFLLFPADWNKHGKSAGFKRNTDIAKFSDILIACVSKDRTGGTEDTIKKFMKFHKEGVVILC